MKQYKLTINGLSPMLMHQDNLAYAEKIRGWQKDPINKELSVSGDDRSPAWVWVGYAYHDGAVFGMPADNMMTLFREGGAKVLTGKGKETFKKQTQAGIVLDQQQMTLFTGGKTVPVQPFRDLIGETDFLKHLEAAEAHGFELLVKRARVGQAKHVRVRPLFRDWRLEGSFTVLDEETSGLTQHVLETILAQAGALCGLGDWRPSSPKSSGTFGRFAAEIAAI